MRAEPREHGLGEIAGGVVGRHALEVALDAGPLAVDVGLGHAAAFRAMASPTASYRPVKNAKSRAFGDLVADFARSVFDYLVRALKIEPK